MNLTLGIIDEMILFVEGIGKIKEVFISKDIYDFITHNDLFQDYVIESPYGVNYPGVVIGGLLMIPVKEFSEQSFSFYGRVLPLDWIQMFSVPEKHFMLEKGEDGKTFYQLAPGQEWTNESPSQHGDWTQYEFKW